MLHEQGHGVSPNKNNALLWCCLGSVAAHALLLHLLPGWARIKDTPPQPLTVELKTPPPPPEVVPPKPLPVQTQPLPRERPKPPPVKPEPVTPPPREQRAVERPVERPVEPQRAPVLTLPPDSPAVTAATPVIPEPKPVPPSEPPPRPQPPAPPAPVTPPRSDAAHLSNPPPNYPMAARRRGDHGTVLLRLTVTADGLAKNVAVEKSSGHPALDDAAVTAVRNWRFVAARQGGQAIDWPYTQAVQFKLD